METNTTERPANAPLNLVFLTPERDRRAHKPAHHAPANPKNPPTRKPIDPSLYLSLGSRIEHVASIAAALGAEAQGSGLILPPGTLHTINTVRSTLETLAAAVESCAGPIGGAA